MTALNLRCWKPRFLLHDWYKPWLRLFLPYSTVQKIHKQNSKHHLEWFDKHGYTLKNIYRFDWDSLIIDWECSRFTKEASQINAYRKWEKVVDGLNPNNRNESLLREALVVIVYKKLKKLGLEEEKGSL
jgi:hypothetical protein